MAHTDYLCCDLDKFSVSLRPEQARVKPRSLRFRPMGVSASPGRRSRMGDAKQLVIVSVAGGALVAGMALPFVGGAAFATKQAQVTFDSLPAELKSLPLPERTYIKAADGTVIATLFNENRIVVPLDDISPMIRNAAVATEDSRFYQHNGVDLKGSLRALVRNSQAGDVEQGSSTITMQYVRNLLITNAKTPEEIQQARVQTIGRKLQEMRYALALEKQESKDEILAGYLNVSYFGAGAYGVEAAARRYFNTSAKDVSLPQAALLAGLVQQPDTYDPTKNPKLATVRRNVVLDRMLSQGYITAAQAATAKATPIAKTLDPQQVKNGCADSSQPYICDFAVHQIENDPRYGATEQDREDLLKRGGLVIQTSLDLHAQQEAQRIVKDYIPANDSSQKALASASVQPGTGNIISMAQNRDWGTKGAGKTTYNYAVDSADGGTIGMQAGSVFKAFTLAAAMEKNVSPKDYISSPQTRTFPAGDWGCGKNFNQKPYTVNNSTGAGTFNMWQGTALSINTYFVELEREVGLCKVVDVAQRMGMKLANGDPLPKVPSFTLGSVEVAPLDVAAAYATLANHGVYCEPHLVTQITDLDGNALFNDNGNCKKAVDRDVADATTAILSGVIDGPIGGRTGAPMSLGRDAAGKTGTTDSNAAVWFAGYTPDLATAVWSGDPRGGFKHPMQDVTINGQYYSAVHGMSLPGPVWKEIMQASLGNSDPVDFDLQSKFNLKGAREGGVYGGTSDPAYDPDSSDNSNSYRYGYNRYGGYYNRYNGR